MSPFGKRILVLVPHPDDEVAGVAAALARARSQGARLFALYLSHGCLPRHAMWRRDRKNYESKVERRLREAAAAAEFFGIKNAGAAPKRAAREIWKDMKGVWWDVQRSIEKCAPDRVWVPAYEGGNPDHDAVNALATKLGGTEVWEFSEYHFDGGRAHSNRFIAERGDEQILPLTREEKEMKRMALKIYASERRNLSYIKCEQESLRPLAKYNYKKPPHPGTLWYGRFQWMPFKHPEVDFTKAEEVSAAIIKFLAPP